jgi:UDP-N-acetylmuramate: L-alanyl-gamma-D-glutamyl-meso-diaminopimelate ligase
VECQSILPPACVPFLKIFRQICGGSCSKEMNTTAHFLRSGRNFTRTRPDIVIVTSLEFDHGDIYRSIEEIEEEFTKLVRRVPAEGTVLVCDQWPRLNQLAANWRSDPTIFAAILSYGFEINSSYRIKLRAALTDLSNHSLPAGSSRAEGSASTGQQLVLDLAGAECRAISTLTGSHNALNLCAAAAAASLAGASAEQIALGIPGFHGVLRRQTLRFDQNDLTVIEDFAHHPTAIEMTLKALRESYPERRIVAIYEPRSATGRRGYFQSDYPASFSSADLVVIQEVTDAGRYSGSGDPIVPLDVKRIIETIKIGGKQAVSFADAIQIETFLQSELRSGDLAVIMTNGDFGGMIPRLVSALKSRT